MATSVILGGSSFSIPAQGDSGWADQVSGFLIQVANTCLQKTGGAFTITAVTDFGGTAGLKALYWSSRSNNPGTTGVVRLANTESVAWRNAANNANLELKVNASDVLEFAGNPLVTLALGTANHVLKMNSGGTAYEWGAITNANIDAAAAIDLAKLAAVTANRVLVSDSSGKVSASSMTDTTLGNLNAVAAYLDPTSSVQTQLDGKQSADTTLTALAAYNTNGLVTQTAADTFTGRTITGTTNRITVSNGDGVSGNPTLDIGSDVVTKTGSETLTNKTITSPSLGSPTISDYALATETTAPSTPSAGKLAVYAKSDHKLYTKDSNGTETQVGAGSSAGITFFFDDFENGSTANWTTYKDAAATTPADGTGGTATHISVSASSSSPLRGTYSLAIANSGSTTAQGEGVAAAFSVPSGYQVGAKRRIAFLWDGTDSNYAAGELTCYIYDVTNSTLITPSATSLPKAKTPVEISWDASTASSYRLVFHVAGTGTAAWTVKVDDVTVDPGKVVNGVARTPSQAYTPSNTQGFGTISGTDLYWQRYDDQLIVFGRFTAGTITSSELQLGLPSGLTIGTQEGNGIAMIRGKWWRAIALTNNRKQGTIIAQSGQSYVGFGTDDYIATESPHVRRNGTQEFNNSETVYVQFQVPISLWAGGSAYLASNDEEFAYNTSTSTTTSDTTSFGYGPSGAVIQNITTTLDRRVRFQSPIQQGDVISVQILENGVWKDINGYSSTATAAYQSLTNQNTTYYGLGLYNVTNSTDVNVRFGQYAAATSTYGAAGSAWSTGSLGSTYWRVRKVKAGAAVGFGAATATSMGLVKGGTVPGTSSNAAIASGYIGEKVSANFTAATTATANTFVDAGGTLTLPAGAWIIFVNANCASVWVTGQPAGQIAVRDSSNNVIQRHNWTPVITSSATTFVSPVSFTVPVNISSSTTYKLSIQCNNNSSAATMSINADEATPIGSLATDSYWYAIRIA